MSTLLQGPYDHLPTRQKRRLQCMVAKEAYDRWFAPDGAFPLRGVQDKVLCRCFHLLDTYLQEHNLFDLIGVDPEETLNDVMNDLDIVREL